MSESDDERVQQVIDALDPTPASDVDWPVSRRQTLRALAAAGLLGAGSGSASAESVGGVIADEANLSNYDSETVSDGWELTIDDDVFGLTESEDTIDLPDGGVGEEVLLPNGAEASQIIAPDGSVVFDPFGIPDSVVTRENDSNQFEDDRELGMFFEPSEEWPDIGFTISQNVINATVAEIVTTDDEQLIGSKDVSSLSSGDSFVINNVNLNKDTEYIIRLSADGNEYTAGSNVESTPIQSDDGLLSITDGYTEGSRANTLYNIVSIGRVGFD